MLATKQKYRADGGIAACHKFEQRKKKEHQGTFFIFYYFLDWDYCFFVMFEGIKRLAFLFPDLVSYDDSKKSDITRPSSFQGMHIFSRSDKFFHVYSNVLCILNAFCHL